MGNQKLSFMGNQKLPAINSGLSDNSDYALFIGVAEYGMDLRKKNENLKSCKNGSAKKTRRLCIYMYITSLNFM